MKIAKKISRFFLIANVILTAVLVSIVYTSVKNEMEKTIFNHLNTAAESRANHIESYLEDHKNANGILASDDLFIEILSMSKEDPEYNKKLEKVNIRLNALMKTDKDIYKISILDKNGVVATSVDKASVVSDNSDYKAFLKVKETTYIQDIHTSETLGERVVCLDIATPLFLNGESLGVFIADMRTEDLFKITLDRTGLSETGEIYLVNKDYYMISPSRFQEDVILKQKVDTENSRECLQDIEKYGPRAREFNNIEQKDTKIFKDYRGVRVLGTDSPIPEMQWALLAEIDVKEAFAPLRMIQLLSVLLLLGIPLAAWLIGTFVSRAIVGPLSELQKGTEVIAAGNLEYKIGIDSNDEIGQLSKSFDKMTGDLKETTTSIDILHKEIIERQKLGASLRESEEKYRTILGTLQEGYFEVDQRGDLTLVNNGFCIITGYSFDELIGMRNKVYLVEKNRKRVIVEFNKVWETGEPVALFEYQLKRKDGELRTVQTSISLKFDKHGEKIGFIGIVRDVTERKMAEMALEKAKQETEKVNRQLKIATENAKQMALIAEAANIAKSAFLANMSHEIRTPLNSVVGFTDILLDTSLNEDQMEYAKTVKRSGNNLLSLIDDILDLAKIEAKELDFEEIDFDPELLTFEVCDLIRPRLGSKPVEILCQIGDKTPSYVKGDPTRFRQVLTNLMGNASKCTESGEIEISLDIEEESDNRVKLHAKIRDTGIGIPKDKLSVIFDPFQQADDSTTRVYGGTGLGLSICRQIANLMDGDVWAESEVNKGSIFHFTAWFGNAEVKEARRFDQVSLSGRKALIVDDNQNNLDMLKHTLESVGMGVVALRSGQDVVPTLQEALDVMNPFDLCLIDSRMPGFSGYEVAKHIRDPKYKFPNLPLIALSSLMDRDAQKCEEAGFDGFLSKPVHRKKLFQMLERVMGVRKDGGAKGEVAKQKIMTQYSVQEERKHSVRILLAEDNVDNQRLAKLMLTKAGYQMEVAGNGEEAVKKYTQSPEDFELIFMDVQMPKMDGIEATKAIRKKGFDTIPIIAMTANAMKGDREKCLKAGMDDYTTKPIKRELVFEMIKKWVLAPPPSFILPGRKIDMLNPSSLSVSP